jgi:hypothetical protein
VLEGNHFEGNDKVRQLDVKSGTPAATAIVKNNHGIILKP